MTTRSVAAESAAVLFEVGAACVAFLVVSAIGWLRGAVRR